MSAPQKYRKLPLTVEAMELDGENVKPVMDWIKSAGGSCWAGEHTTAAPGGRNDYPFNGARSVWINTREGHMRADPGDYVVREPNPSEDRRFYPVKADLFATTYEAVQA